MRQLSGALAIVLVLVAGCAKRPSVGTEGAGTQAAAPFTNQELVSELRRQGVGTDAGSSAEGPHVTETGRGVMITLPSTFFAFDRSDLDAPARQVIDKIAQVMNHPRAANRTIKLEGHTDNVGTAAYNLTLSRNRADSVAKELATQGVPESRITVEAFGETRPVAPNRKSDGSDDPAGRAKNRRVEAVILN